MLISPKASHMRTLMHARTAHAMCQIPSWYIPWKCHSINLDRKHHPATQLERILIKKTVKCLWPIIHFRWCLHYVFAAVYFWLKTSLISFLVPPSALEHYTSVTCVSRNWLQLSRLNVLCVHREQLWQEFWVTSQPELLTRNPDREWIEKHASYKPKLNDLEV